MFPRSTQYDESTDLGRGQGPDQQYSVLPMAAAILRLRTVGETASLSKPSGTAIL